MKKKTILKRYQCPACGKVYTVYYTDGIKPPRTEFRQGKGLLVCPECLGPSEKKGQR